MFLKDGCSLKFLEITSNFYETEPTSLIIKEPSSILFNFTETKLNGMIKSIRSDAYFIFANLESLNLINLKTFSTKQIAQTIYQFEQVNFKNKKLDSIELYGYSPDMIDVELLSNYQIKKLNINKKDFSITEFNTFKHHLKHLTEIDFHLVDLRNLDETTFEFCASTLERLYLSSSYPREQVYTSALFNKLSNLKELRISNGEFLINNDLLKIPTRLTKLELFNFNIKELKRDSFKYLVNLVNLDLNNNYIAHIEPGSFNGLSNLTHLNLRCSKLTILEEGVFQGLINLEDLTLFFSRSLKSIGARVFSGLSKLKNLDLSKCEIECIDQDAFDDSQKIDFLNLSENELKQFVTKCSPKKLDLSLNRNLKGIKFIGSDLSNIEEVNLDENKNYLKDFNSMFQNGDQLNVKKMTVTFEALDSHASFSHMNTLKELNVHKQTNNQLIRISYSAFHGLTNLESLNLKLFDLSDKPSNVFYQQICRSRF